MTTRIGLATLSVLCAVIVPNGVRAQTAPAFELRVSGTAAYAFGGAGPGFGVAVARMIAPRVLGGHNSLGVELQVAWPHIPGQFSARTLASLSAVWRSRVTLGHGGPDAFIQLGGGAAESIVPSECQFALASASGNATSASPSCDTEYGPVAATQLGLSLPLAERSALVVGGQLTWQRIYPGHAPFFYHALLGLVIRL